MTLTVREADPRLIQTANPSGTVDAGQPVTYTLDVINPGAVDIYDLELRSTLPAGMTYVASSTTPQSGPVIGEPDVSGQTITWGRNQSVPLDIDLSAGQSMQFTYQVLIGDGVEPDEQLADSMTVDWTSLDGDPGPDLGVAVGAPGRRAR